MELLPRITLAILADHEADCYYVSVTIGDDEHELGTCWTAEEAGKKAASWVRDRGLRFGRDSARRLDEVQRTGRDLVVFDVVVDD